MLDFKYNNLLNVSAKKIVSIMLVMLMVLSNGVVNFAAEIEDSSIYVYIGYYQQDISESAISIEATGEFHSFRDFQDGEDWIREYMDIYGNVTAITLFIGMTPDEYDNRITPRWPGTRRNYFNVTVRAAENFWGTSVGNRTGVVVLTATNDGNGNLSAFTAANVGHHGWWGAPGWTLSVRNVSRSGSRGTATFFLNSFELESSNVTIDAHFFGGGELSWHMVNAPHGGSASFIGGSY